MTPRDHAERALAQWADTDADVDLGKIVVAACEASAKDSTEDRDLFHAELLVALTALRDAVLACDRTPEMIADAIGNLIAGLEES